MIQLLDASFAFSARTILDAATLRLPPGGRIGLLGRNGAGKTTLFRLLLGELRLDSGEIGGQRPRGIAYLSQHPDLPGDETILEHVMAAHPTLRELERRILELERRMEDEVDPSRLDRLVEQHRTLSRDFEAEGGYAIEARVSRILEGLGVSRADLLKTLGILSPGEKNRVALAKVLLSRAELLLLDEPTNHLDLGMVEWLESFLVAPSLEGLEKPPTIIVASHDRYFLNTVATHIAELRAGKLYLYEGGYDDFARQRAEELERQEKLYRQQATEVEKELEFIRRNFAGQKARQAKSREKKLSRIAPVARPDRPQEGPRMRFRDIERAGDDVLEAEHLECGYGSEVLLRDVRIELQRGERVALLGPNGCGKTTLIKTLLGELPPLRGVVKRGSRTRLGHYAQDVARHGSEKSVFDDLHDAVPSWTNQEVLDLLAAFLFRGDDVRQKTASLSGGEKARYALLRLLISGANCLFLDEPTNHLDIYARAALEESLLEFPETVVLVSHDRYLIDRVADRILFIEDGRLREALGSYEEYRAARRAEEEQTRATEERARQSPRCKEPARVDDRKAAQQAARREERLMLEISRVEGRIEETRAACGLEENYRDPAAMRRLKEELRALEDSLALLYRRWEAGEY